MVVPANALETTAAWTVVYDRADSDTSSVDAEELASALLAFRQLCLRSNAILNGNATTASLRVVATDRGSFEILLELSVVYLSVVAASGVHMLPGDFWLAASTLKSVLIGNGAISGVIGIFKALKGRRYAINEINADTVNIIEGDVNLNITMGEHSVLQDVGIRGSLQGIINPLRNGSFDSITIRDDNNAFINLEPDNFDWEALDESSDEPLSTTDKPSQMLRVTAPNLENRNAKWQLSDGNTTRWYSIIDDNFLQRVFDGEERFGKGDILECDVRIIQTTTNGDGIKSDYQITRVTRHGTGGTQLSFTGL